MYQRESKGWFKHYDFILLDLICLQIAFFLAYVIRGVGWNPYSHLLYRNMAIFIEAADIVVIFFFETLKNVLKRGHYVEFIETLKHVLIVCAVSMSYLFLIKEAEKFEIYSDYDNVLLFCLDLCSKRSQKISITKADGRWKRPFPADCDDFGYCRNGNS